MRFIVGVAEVHINWTAIEADNLDAALAKASEGDEVDLEDIEEVNYSHTLESDEFKVRLPNGDEVTAEEALDLEGAGERVGE